MLRLRTLIATGLAAALLGSSAAVAGPPDGLPLGPSKATRQRWAGRQKPYALTGMAPGKERPLEWTRSSLRLGNGKVDREIFRR